MVEPSMTIDGQEVTTTAWLDVVDPSSGAVCGRAPKATTADLGRALEAAARAGGEAWGTDEEARCRALRAMAEAVEAHQPELAELLTTEQGKPLTEARAEVGRAAQWLSYYADLQLAPELIRSDAAETIELFRRPVGVVAAITPWNAPVMLASWKIAPALRTGNTVVLKPSPFTPLTTLRLGELWREMLPAGVLNVVSGGDDLGAAMTAHPLVRKISFTGSVAAGAKVAAAGAVGLKRLTLELGGNDAAILLDDVDIDQVVPALFWSAFRNCGQVCSAVKRVYVPKSCYDKLVEAMVAMARSVRLGPGRQDGVELGPVSNAPQLARVMELVDDAAERGAQVVVGGPVAGSDGWFFSPAIVAGATAGSRLVDEEQFGPALPIVSYRQVDDAIRQANDTEYGLSGSVWGSDPERLRGVADALECGRVGINEHPGIGPDQPFAGWKSSGLGVENGHDVLLQYTQPQVRYYQQPTTKR